MAGWPFEREHAAAVTNAELLHYQSLLINILRDSGEVSLRHFREDVDVDNKLAAGFDPVTIADRACEAFICAELTKHFPQHSIFGEESGYQDNGANLCWVVDPIDGTRSFICGVPLWGTLMALNDGKKPILGGMYQPWSNELFIGTRDEAYFCRGDQRSVLKTSSVANLAEAKVACTTPEIFEEPAALNAFNKLARQARLVRFGTDCYGYALLAQGGLDLVVEDSLQPYDIQAMIPIIEGAGGVVTNWKGQDASLGGRVVAAANRELHTQALVLLDIESKL